MKTTYLRNAEFKPPVEAYQKSLAQLSQAEALSKEFSEIVAQIEEIGVSAGSPPLAVRPDQPKEQYQRAASAISPLLQEFVNEANMIQTLKAQVQSAEQTLAAALKLEKTKRLRLIVFSIIGILFLLVILSQCKG